MPLVAGVDSSTQSCKVVIRDAETGALLRHGSAPHPAGTEVHPDAWWDALQSAVAAAGGLDDVAAISVGGQQHGMVCLDASGAVVRPALLWNDTRSAASAAALIREAGHGSDEAGQAALGCNHRHSSRCLDYGHQAALAGRKRAGACRPHRRSLPSARLAELAAGRIRARQRRRRIGGAADGPLGCLRHRLLVSAHRHLS